MCTYFSFLLLLLFLVFTYIIYLLFAFYYAKQGYYANLGHPYTIKISKQKR